MACRIWVTGYLSRGDEVPRSVENMGCLGLRKTWLMWVSRNLYDSPEWSTDDWLTDRSINYIIIDYTYWLIYWFKDEDICRICLDNKDKEDLVRVCRCKGSAKYAHKSCILRWFHFSCRYECELCQYKMKIKKHGLKPVREVSIVSLWFRRDFNFLARRLQYIS